MVMNLWNRIHFCCKHRHEQPIPFKVMEGTSAFYACPKYMRQDEEHPDGHTEDEPACPNRVSFTDAEKIVSMLSDEVQESLLNGEMTDFTGLKYKYKYYDVEVLKYNDDRIELAVLNNRAIHQ